MSPLTLTLFFLVINEISGDRKAAPTEKIFNIPNNKTNLTRTSMKNILRTCCAIDLLNEIPGKCMKVSKEKDFIPTKSVDMPAHLMAENRSFTFLVETQERRGCLESETITISMNWNSGNGNANRSSFFLRNGYLKIENHYFHPDEYCINGKNGPVLELLVCPQNCQGLRPCIFKCCGLHQVYDIGFTKGPETKGCQNPEGNYFSPILYKNFGEEVQGDEVLGPHYVEKYPTSFRNECYERKIGLTFYPSVANIIAESFRINFPGHPFQIRDDGSILYKDSDGTCAAIDPRKSHVCIDGVTNFGPTYIPFQNNPEDLVVIMCTVQPKEGTNEDGGLVYGIMLLICPIFLFLTIAVYFMLWERQNVHGWTILSHAIAMFFMYIFLGVSHTLRITEGHSILNTPACFYIGVLCHFFFLSTFCWLSMISVDLWLTFRAITPRSTGKNSKGYKRYSLYSILGWGVPAAIVATGWILTERNPHPEMNCSNVIIPGYGIENCYLQEKGMGIYLYYPVAAMIGINILFFGITSIKLFLYQKSAKIVNDDAQVLFYRLFFKLFFVMGILYIFELISWAVSGTGVFWYWVVFDVLNILRPFVVFIIFVCKPDILWALEQKYPWLKPLLIPFAFITRQRRDFSQRRAETESMGLNSSMSTRQSTFRTTINRPQNRMD